MVWRPATPASPARSFRIAASDFRHCLALEGLLARQAFKQDTAKGPDIRALVDRFPCGLLRAHVRCRAENHARAGHLVG